ncbi:hypothetical protein ASPACDRAFT_40542 [Aspergillus aculeatus ATCC 16872]|uniref:C3H1-type domain-containing protein n=1 Tax=Aspergillus aculeatus (strain ATCC 16872 / CBS 172.66 / WB 5094) TaxID=690307 RepID=A0A1L9X4H6_ASPA1|nr:uncharacterized protein ASPACDRAFT_40542 [Aspergillus aculeatus ATCC 16872]OJK03219.1 hypothetical protein ASPACDRAFT_40542 [Aspergillus aculeatus ATCC 16872]
MPVCQHFLKGRCKYGDRCYNEHPGKQTVGGNKFAALSGGGGGGGGGGGRGGQNQQNAQYGITAADIKVDLTPGKGLPEWIFSCYGPGRDAPRQLFGGPQREQSFEELRLRHYELVAQGSPIEVAVSEAQGLHNEARNQMENALRDLDGAVRYILDGAKEHPNRIDIVNNKAGTTFGAPPKLFGEIKAPPATGPAFGEPALLGDQAYAKPSIAPPIGFGQPSNLAHATGFGQPSAFNQGSSFGKPSAQSAFGQPAFGQPAPGFGQPSFGQPSAAGATASPFGKASGGFGASASTPSPFAQFANAKSGASTFGQPSASPFASAQPSNPFGQAIPSSGATNQRPAEPAFGQSGFAQLGQQASAARPAAASGFGAASTPAAPGFGTPAAPGFGAPAAPGFGTASTPATSGFGTASTPATSGFGAASTPAASGFGAASTPAATGFGIPTTSAAPPAAPAAPTAPLGPGPAPVLRTRNPSELSPIPPLNGQTIRDPMTRRLTSWKGQPVTYINDVPCYLHPQDRKTYVRIFFPDGPPDEASLRDAQARPEEYTAEVTQQYEYFVTNGCFENGVIPSVPPKTEWVSFDF